MYSYIKGKVTEINSSYIVLENNNIGYRIHVTNPYKFKIDEEVKMYLYEHIREDEHLLYGFKEQDYLNFFLKLISVKGLGPKTALPLLEEGLINEVKESIDTDNIAYLKKFPKIGDKVARQIVLDLKGKLVVDKISEYKELKEALLALGYKAGDINKTLPNIKEEKIEKQITEALKLLSK
jgi:Holliday junction DNA helicase RuvA